VFLGSLKSEAVDTITFTDKKFDLKAEISFGKVKKRYFCCKSDPLITSSQPSTRTASLSANLTGVTAAISTSKISGTGMEGSSNLSE